MQKISVIVPTYNRHKYLRNMLGCFLSQTYPNIELLICDDSDEPSTYLKAVSREYPNIYYAHVPMRMTIGAKRNLLIRMASGDFIAQFDDDDYYAPNYLEAMMFHLQQQNVDFITLSRWFAYSVEHDCFAYWATDYFGQFIYQVGLEGVIQVLHEHTSPNFIEGTLWGFGFSYFFKKEIFEQVQFQDINFAEDYYFHCQLNDYGFKSGYFPDEQGLVLHLLHPQSTSQIYPQYLLPSGIMPTFFPNIKTFLQKLE